MFDLVKTNMLSPQAVADCVQSIQLLLQQKSQEVLKAAIGFVKVAVVSLSRRS